ncbi:MAG: XrtA system polysaccharide deacetylase [Pyrinomonadaceae bacterium]
MDPANKNKRHLLTVLVEDYFHVGAFENLIQQRNWQNFEPRYEQNTLKTLDLLDRHHSKATFFVLGWIAERNPGLIREIVDRGHEVASRGFYHRSLKNLTDEEFREDLRRTNRAIEDACGQKVLGYRAPEKLSFDQKEWILDILADEGFVYDASFLPTRKTPKAKRIAHQIHTGGKVIWEFPYSTRDLGLRLLPISGGNYFRQIPYTLMRHAVRGWHARHDAPFVFYFHVWELDPEQPRISAASNYNRIRHYRKLDKMEWIINENLDLYDCVGVAEHLGLTSAPPAVLGGVNPVASQISVKPPATASGVDRPTPVSIVIPCYNEQESLPYLANTLRAVEANLSKNGYKANIIFVDDCSTDETLRVMDELFGKLKNVKILQHETNRGVAAGIMTGIRAAKTDVVCSMDCDCTYDPHELVNMLPLLEENVDLVTASPYHRDGGVRNVPHWRLFLSRGASFLYRRVLRSKLDTYTSCFRVYRRSSMIDLKLRESGFLGVAEMLGRLDLSGGKIVEFPTILEVRLFGVSKMKTAKTILGHLNLLSQLIKLRWFRKSVVIKTSLPSEELKVVSENTTD